MSEKTVEQRRRKNTGPRRVVPKCYETFNELPSGGGQSPPCEPLPGRVWYKTKDEGSKHEMERKYKGDT